MSAESVRAIAADLHNVCAKHDQDPAELLTAIAWAAYSACHSFGVPAEHFIENFRKMMSLSGHLVDTPTLSRSEKS